MSRLESNTEIIAQNHLEIVPSDTKRYTFEMPLSAGIPETIHSSQININYELSVKLDYYKSSSICHEEYNKPVVLARLPENGMLAGENHSNTTIDSRKHFSNWCQYRITLDKKAIFIGSTLPVKLEIAPLVTDLKIKQVVVQLIEKCTFNDTNITSQSVHYMYPAKGYALTLPVRSITKPWEASCTFQIPNEKKQLSHSTDNYASFNIQHTLAVSFVISVPTNNSGTQFNTYGQGRFETKTISFQTDIDLLDSHLSTLVHCELPPYNCPVSNEELYKLNSHGLAPRSPPKYEEAIIYPPLPISIIP